VTYGIMKCLIMKKKIIVFFSLLASIFVMVSACRDVPPAPEIPQDAPSDNAVASPRPTVTLPPKEAPTLNVPEATYTPLPTMTAEILASPLPTADTELKATEDLDAVRNPLTGEIMTDPTILQRRPIAIKISNAPAKYTRPQSGLGQADLVYEHVTEGSLTRFTAVIYGQTPENIGPIRSARLIDLEIPLMYDAALAYSGSSIGVSQRLFSSDFSASIIRPHEEGYYRTGENKPYEHTLYAHPDGLWNALDERGQNYAPYLSPLMTFSEDLPDEGSPAEVARVRYRKWTDIEWRFDPDSLSYYRWVDGEEHIDANSGEQISAANVVLLFVPHRFDKSICEQQSGSSCLASSVEIQLSGLGSAILLRGGHQYEVFWRRYNQREMINLADANGDLVPMQVGNTWYQVIPLDYPDPVTIE
jgi:hypothetical protein